MNKESSMTTELAPTKSLNRGSINELVRRLHPAKAGALYALILIVITFQILTSHDGLPSFLSVSNVRNLLDQSALDGMLVVSMTVLLITGNFDLSVGASAGFCGAVGLTVANHAGPVAGLVAAILAGVCVGLLNGAVVQLVGVNSFIATLGTLTALEGALLVVTNGNTILAGHKAGTFGGLGTASWSVNRYVVIVLGVLCLLWVGQWLYRRRQSNDVTGTPSVAAAVLILGIGFILIAALTPGVLGESRETWVMLGTMVLVSLVLRFTIVGRRAYAVGGSVEAARLSGINVTRYKIMPFVLVGITAGIAGVMYAGKFGAVDPTALTSEELPVIAAAVLGGTSLFGGAGYATKSVIGTLILVTLADGFGVTNLSANYQYLVQGGVIIAAASIYTVAGKQRFSKRKTATSTAVYVTAPEPA
jgi:D-xylose transport system permease protein